MSQKHHNLWWIIWYLIGASCCVDGPSGSSQCVRGDTVCQRGTVGIGNDICQEGLSALQSEVMWERWDRIRMAREGQRRRIGMTAFIYKCTISWDKRISINHIRMLANKQRLAAELIHVKHVVITHVEHESAPSGPALRVRLVSCHHWNNTAT